MQKQNQLRKSIFAILFAVTALGSYFVPKPQEAIADNLFKCGRNNGVFSTYLKTPRGWSPLINWNQWETAKWSHQKRCVEVATRLNNFSTEERKSFRPGTMNGQPVICTSGSNGCNKLVVTFRPGVNPRAYLDQLRGIFNNSNVPPLRLSTNDPFSFAPDGTPILNMNNVIALSEYLPAEPIDQVQVIDSEDESYVAPIQQQSNNNQDWEEMSNDQIWNGSLRPEDSPF